jgi:CRISPR-associated endonuclease/helicase Cas3
VIKPVAAAPPDSRDVEISFKSDADAVLEALETAQKGGCVLWVCDTVDSAQRMFRHFSNRNDVNFPVGLLHAHFPFWRREQLEKEWMNRLEKNSSTRCGSILISTQIVEQSVDLDGDLLITELAPTDMLFQRMGRLWRHDRERPVSKPRVCIIEERKNLAELRRAEPKAIVKALGGKAHVYNAYVLLRSLEVWKKRRKVKIPGQIRTLIETTYKQRVREPKTWQKLFDAWFATDSGKKFLAARNSNLWQVALEDEEGVETRLNELPHLSLVLCGSITEKGVRFVDETSCSLGGEEFQLATAQGIHRNLVKIPDYHFERTDANPLIARYLRGRQCVGLVQSNGTITVRGLKNGVVLRWDIQLGVVIEKTEGKEDQ